MNAEELRIGNLLLDNEFNQIFEVQGIDIKDLQINKIKTYEAILLTEKWLKELGFIQEEVFPWVYYLDDFKVNTGNHWTWQFCNLVIRDIKYVHQLQNLYFLLTGNELKRLNEPET